MRAFFGLAAASMLSTTTALANNSTAITVTVTQTSWSTIISTIPCPAPSTVTLYNAQGINPSSIIANKADIIYQTISEYQAGQVLNIGGAITTLAQATTLTLYKTISDLVVVPNSAIDNVYTAAVSLTDVVYPTSMTGTGGQVVTCQTGVTTIDGDDVLLTNCPCTVQSTILEVTATGVGAVPTALVPSTNYIVKIIYVYLIESVVEQVSTTITATATNTLTTIQTETVAVGTTTTTTSDPRPTMVTLDSVAFLLEYDTSYDGVAAGNLRKRQTSSLSGISPALNGCLSQCAEQVDCVATSLDESTSSCSPLVRYNAESRRTANGNTFAMVIFRPAALTTSSTSISSSGVPSSTRSSISISSTISTSSIVNKTPISPATSGTTRMSPVPGSSSGLNSKSALFPVSNSSIVSSTSILDRRSSSSAPLPIAVPSSILTRPDSSSSLSTFVSITDSSTMSAISSSSSTPVLSTLNSTSILTTSSPDTTPIISSTLGSTSVSSSRSDAVNNSTVSTTSASFTSTSVSSASTSSALTSSASTSSVAPFTACAVASDISGYPPAMSYCSSAFPLAASTSLYDTTTTGTITVSAPATTIYSNVTLTTQTTVQTNEETVTDTSYSSSELTVTETISTTTTATVTDGTTFVKKRQAMSTAQSSIFSSILARPSSDIALVCSCLQTPATISITNTQTATSTTTITPIFNGQVTITPPIVTLQTTETDTITVIR
ncbi:hypothetical protein D6C85_00619 [Aureobasidium pullulans]|uniref:Apple domain-containing protein n=1 Tax=Aureobasidium pullulans TaxID=5580 RepID=A0A4S9XI21_AURPU|nr:hypothetical protein D6C85_00619 [Aureobasidium pullulans]